MTVHVDLHVFMRDQRWVFIDNNLDRSIGRSEKGEMKEMKSYIPIKMK